MSQRQPRLVIVTRKTPLEQLVERHGTIGQARYYLQSRGQDSAWYEQGHQRFVAAFAEVQAAIPASQRRVRVDRDGLDRFLFAPDDVVIALGQDGLVANVAKYVNGQIVIGINPDPSRYDGVLCPHPPGAAVNLLAWLEGEHKALYQIQKRSMAIAVREDGQRLLALNEIFAGHRTHQSARYRLRAGDREERHSSSGLICSTGTGSTGWARSITRQRGLDPYLPGPADPRLVWFVREPFPSVATGCDLDFGLLEAGQSVVLVSEMAEDGVVFADGIETDRVEFLDGQTITLSLADRTLNLVVAAGTTAPSRPIGRPAPGSPPPATGVQQSFDLGSAAPARPAVPSKPARPYRPRRGPSYAYRFVRGAILSLRAFLRLK